MGEKEKNDFAIISRRGFLKNAAIGTVAVAGLGGAGVLVGCDSGEAAAGSVVSATATSQGHGGPVTVTLDVDTGQKKIVGCEITGDEETPEIGGRAIAQMPEILVDAGGIAVDGISGATVTSTAILSASTSAYNQALGITAGEVKMAPGQYTGEGLGYWGIWNLPVTITVNETSILKIETPSDRFEHGETEVILQSVIDNLFPRIIECQSIAVDSITGATASSNAAKIAIEQALKEALVAGGSDESAIEHFKNLPAKPKEGETEELDCDILVVGMGGGCIMAYRSAMEQVQKLNNGKMVSIIAIEKAGKFGGKSALAHETLAVNPPRYKQIDNNGEDWVDGQQLYDLWMEHITREDGTIAGKPDVLKTFLDESGNTIDWMYSLGWRFGTMKTARYVDGSDLFNAVLTSNLDNGTYEDRRKIVDQYYRSVVASVVAQGGKYMLETEAYEYISDGDTVTGVKARNNVTGKEYVIRAKAVIQGTGGFGSNTEMLEKYPDPKWAGPRKVVGTGMDDGKMLEAAIAIGAGTWNMDMMPMCTCSALEHKLAAFEINFYGADEKGLNGHTGRQSTWTLNDVPLGMGIDGGALFVDKNGKRFVNEADAFGWPATVTENSWKACAAGNYFYAVYSTDQVELLKDNGFTHVSRWESYNAQGGYPDKTPIPEIYDVIDAAIADGLMWKGDTLDDLAGQIGIDANALNNTIEQYNSYCASGTDKEFGKTEDALTAIKQEGPYYAVKIINAGFGTAAGLNVDAQIRVLKDDNETPIQGLYAIGLDSMGVIENNEMNYPAFGGVAQGWLCTSARLAGINAATFVHETYGLAEVDPALVESVGSMTFGNK